MSQLSAWVGAAQPFADDRNMMDSSTFMLCLLFTLFDRNSLMLYLQFMAAFGQPG